MATYAYTYGYFTNSAYTAGPLTATQSVAGDGNGVFCYDTASCLPTATYLDSNYWASPIWSYRFAGFYQPIDNGVWNSAKAGSAVPIKFSLGGDQGLDVIKPGYPKLATTSCPDATTTVDAVEETLPSTASALTYDSVSKVYTYAWKSSKTGAGKCYSVDLGLDDDSAHTFKVVLR
jgi:hypothetical protein